MAYSNGEILIEKDIKLPEYEHHCKYPFANMAVGDSFEISIISDKPSAVIQSAATYWRKVTGKVAYFTVRSKHKYHTNSGIYTVRVWRVQ